MHSLISFLKSWLGSLIGLVILACLIYFLGPAIGIKGVHPLGSEFNRYLAIGLLFICWASWQAWRGWQVRKKNQQMLKQLVQPAAPKASPDEVATREELDQLSGRLQEALKSLEKSKQAQGGGAVHLTELPWYIIIGPPGSGKTTLLANSGLHFPLSDQYGKDAVRGVGGTRNCDWWFTNDAILLDTAGRYTTQDSQQTIDQAAWLGFLNLLKQYRGRQPINGVLVAVSLTDLVQQSAEIQSQHAKAIRQRIQELYEHLGIQFPVYMLFTKADLVAGFTEFFDALDKENREQVWGMTFPYTPNPESASISQFLAEFALLEERLNQQIIEKIDKERSTERKRAIYLFPQQFSSLKNNLQQFLEQIYQSNRYESAILLRGVYFTSATQEGMPIDRIMVSLANSFGVKPQQVNRFSAQGKSFFINRLLTQVIFKESGLAGHNLKLERQLQWVQGFALIGAVVLALIAMILWAASYWYNRHIQQDFMANVSKVQQQVATIPVNDIPRALGALDQLRLLSWEYANPKPTVSWLTRLGLNQEISLRKAMDDQYEDLLKSALNPQIKQLLESKISSSLGKPQQVSVLFSSLKNYLFLGGQAPQGLQPVEMPNLDWNNNGQVDAEDSSIAVHTKNLLALGSSSNLDSHLVDQARKSLLETQIDRLSYVAFMQRGIEQAKPYDFMVLDKKGLNNINASFQKKSKKAWSNNVPGFFTRQGYEEVFLPNYQKAADNFTKESWVLGESVGRLQDSEQLANEYQKFYQEDYIAAWQAFLQDLAPQNIPNLQAAKTVLIGLTSNESNMLFRLMEEVTAQTNFKTTKNKSLLSFSNEAELEPLVAVDAQFKLTHGWVTDAARFNRTNQLIDEIYAKLDQPDAFGRIDNNALTNAIGELKGETLKLPEPFKSLMSALTEQLRQQVNGQIQGELRKQLAVNLKSQLGDFCQTRLANKYPLVANAAVGVNLADFSDFFASRGLVKQFSDSFLQGQTADQATLTKVKHQLAGIQPISRAFFPIDNLRFTYSLRVVNLAPKFQAVHLTTGIQNQIFKNGESKSFNWPDGNEITLQGELAPQPAADPAATTDPTASTPLTQPPASLELLASKKGDEWLIFRLFEKKKWVLPGLVEIQLVSTPNSPFQVATKELRSFKCPTL